MADTGGNVDDDTLYFINLPCFYLSTRKIRFLLIDDQASVQLPMQSNFDEVNGTPLFLGCDILAGTDLQPKNFNRVYSKYAKEGLACKISPRNFRFVGIKHGNLWFYNIQGLFQIIFQYQSKNAQRHCLTVLKDVWLNQYGARPLQDSLTVSLSTITRNQTAIKDTALSLSLTDVPLTSDRTSKLQANTNIVKDSALTKLHDETSSSNDSAVIADNGFIVHGTTHLQEGNLSDAFKLQSQHKPESMHKEQQYQTNSKGTMNKDKNKSTDGSASATTPGSASEVHFIVSYPENAEITKLTKHVQTACQVVKQKSCQTDSKTCNVSTQTEGDRFHRDTVSFYDKCCRYLDNIILGCKGDRMSYEMKIQTMLQIMEMDNESFLSVINQMYLDTLKNLDNDDLSLMSVWKLSRQRHAFLTTICCWLGNELHKFEPIISQNVEKFKQDNINCIDNLPSSETIVDMIFPPCMKELILNWTGQGHVSGAFVNHSSLNDHNYSPPSKASKLCTGGVCFPLVQHILEFANNALVSGVAHVVYSRLRHAQ